MTILGFVVKHWLGHWHGRHSVAVSLLSGIIAPLALVLGIQTFILDEQVARGNWNARITASLLLILYAILFIWQLVGLNRSVERHATAGSLADSLVVNALFALAAVYCLTRLTDLSTSQDSFGKPRPLPGTGLTAIQDSLDLQPHDNNPDWLVVSGTIGIAATRQLRTYLQSHSTPTTLVLESDGGNIYEARGIGKIIADNQFSTHVESRCFSACTLAFVQGNSRTAGNNAEFGFHSYRVDSRYPKAVIVDVASQQQKDELIFRNNGVSENFITRIYQTSANQLWKPDQKQLRKSGFLDAR